MRQIFLILIVFLIFQFSVFAQTETSPCPKISVSGPASPFAESPWTYTASVENSENIEIEYLWQTTAGKIIAGQGTRAIELDIRDTKGRSITVTVEIKGLPENCPNSFSEHAVADILERNDCLTGREEIARFEEASQLDKFIARLRLNPDFWARVTLKFAEKSTAEQNNSRIFRIAKHFALRKAFSEMKRVVFIVAKDKKDKEEGAEICFLAAEDSNASCDDCKVIKGADIDWSKFSKPKKPKK